MTADNFTLEAKILRENNEKLDSNIPLSSAAAHIPTIQVRPFNDTNYVLKPSLKATTPPTYPAITSTNDPASDPISSNVPRPTHNAFSPLTESNLSAHDSSPHRNASRSDRDRRDRLKNAGTELGFELTDHDIPPLHEGKTPMQVWMAEK
ncbi:hypothetical protein BU16DRAFT_559602 [Lophium mytilinum]|uniref:Uncharacterized protein n=1 Tax=Lophium mytilinum TaxID=390894 RepID=A0A6A6R046_9PEZI|nr:hypothetical protein BU16DRAFT_559602 [Lophium mytilinum]